MSRWWRAYDEAVDDPKLGALTDRQHRAWFNLCCITSQNGGFLPAMPAVAFKLRVSVDKAKAMIAELVALKLFDFDEEGKCRPHNWDVRQYKTDVTDPTAASRAKRYRDKKRDADRDATVTQGVTDKRPETETETETEKNSSLRSESARKRGARLPADWQPCEADAIAAIAKLGDAGASEELSKFRDYWKAQPGQRGVKLDWDATWRNWIRNAKGPQGNGRRTVQDAARDLHENILRQIDAFDEPAPSGLRIGEGEGPVRLLPPR